MSFMDLIKKKDMEEWPFAIEADAKGVAIPMEEIPDPVFAGGILGICCGIEPEEGTIYAPTDGVISQVADTLHAIGMECPNGVELLIHIGVDTVKMNGDGFTCQVRTGDKVKKGQPIMTVDIDKIRAVGYSAMIITAVTNTDDFGGVDFAEPGETGVGKTILSVRKEIRNTI